MSYYATFKPTKEAMDEVKKKDPLSYRIDNVESLKKEMEMELLMLCMKGSEDTVRNVMFGISTRLHMLKNIAIHSCIENAYAQYEKDPDKEIYWCGWDKARRECDWTDQSVLDNTIEDLLMFALIIPTKDYYNQDENELFYEKWNSIKEKIEGFSESIYDWYIFEIMEQLVDYRTGEDVGDTWWKKKEDTVTQETSND